MMVVAGSDNKGSTPIAQDLEGARVPASTKTALLVFLGYLVVLFVAGRFFAGDAEYGDVAESAENTRDMVALPVACAAVYLTIVTSVLGWWRPAIFEPRRRAPLAKWLWAIPVLAIVFPIADIARSEHRGEFTTTHWWWLGIGIALVGYSEELMTRGLLLVGMRAEWVERKVFLATTLLFALMHGLNALGGQDIGTTIKQILSVIPMAILFYVVRRVTGSLVWSMVSHFLVDFSLIVFGGTSATLNQLDTSGTRPWGVGVPLLLAVIAVLVYRKTMFSGNTEITEAS
jgi:membrane protease YdiL (CAAX protease family)